MSKLLMIFMASMFLIGCGSLNATREIVPMPEMDMTILPRTKGIMTTKDNITVVVAYLRDVKELDGFGVMIVNETPNWISLKKEECMLILDGEVVRPLSDSKALARLGSGYKQKMPDELVVDISDVGRRDINMRGSRGLKVVDEDKKISIITGSKETIFLYFNTRGSTSPMQLIIPNIYNEATNQRTKFSFRFQHKGR